MSSLLCITVPAIASPWGRRGWERRYDLRGRVSAGVLDRVFDEVCFGFRRDGTNELLAFPKVASCAIEGVQEDGSVRSDGDRGL